MSTSPFNDKSKDAETQLDKIGIFASTSARACMMNEFVLLLSRDDQRAVVPIMAQLISQEVDNMPGASNFTYVQRVRAITKMATDKDEEFVQEVLQFNKISPDAFEHHSSDNTNSGYKMLRDIVSASINPVTAAKILHAAVRCQGVDLKGATHDHLVYASEIVKRAQHAGLDTEELKKPVELQLYK